MPQPFKKFADTRVMLKAEMSWWGERSGFEKRTDLSSACWSMRMKKTFSENEIQNANLLTKRRRKWTLSRKWKQRAAEAPRVFGRARLRRKPALVHTDMGTRALQVSVYQLSFHKHSHTRQLQPLANPPDNYASFFFFFVSKRTQENLTARSKKAVAKAKALNAPFPPHENVEKGAVGKAWEVRFPSCLCITCVIFTSFSTFSSWHNFSGSVLLSSVPVCRLGTLEQGWMDGLGRHT